MSVKWILGKAAEVALTALIVLPVYLFLNKDTLSSFYLLFWALSGVHTFFMWLTFRKSELMLLLCFSVTRRQCTWRLLWFRLACAGSTAAVSLLLWLLAGRFLSGSALETLPAGMGFHMMISAVCAMDKSDKETNRWVMALWVALVAVWVVWVVISRAMIPWASLCIGIACQILAFFGDDCNLKTTAVTL